jgi:hypothetical protein
LNASSPSALPASALRENTASKKSVCFPDQAATLALDFSTFPSYHLPMKTQKRKGVITLKTSIEIPEDLWTEAKIRAAREKKSLQEVVADALREHLKRPRKGGKKDG